MAVVSATTAQQQYQKDYEYQHCLSPVSSSLFSGLLR
jgi:hypothetical protein